MANPGQASRMKLFISYRHSAIQVRGPNEFAGRTRLWDKLNDWRLSDLRTRLFWLTAA